MEKKLKVSNTYQSGASAHIEIRLDGDNWLGEAVANIPFYCDNGNSNDLAAENCKEWASHQKANANAELIVTAVNAYYPMLEALKSISVNASINLDLHKEGQIQNLSKCVNMLLKIAKEAIALAEKADEYKGKFNNNEEGRSMQASLQKVKEMVNAALVQEGLDEMRAQKENKQ